MRLFVQGCSWRIRPTSAKASRSPLANWLALYNSANPDVRLRAAQALVKRPDTPLRVLLDTLDTLSHKGLGADVCEALLSRQDPDLYKEMVGRLESNDHFLRETACTVLGRSGNPSISARLLPMLDDPHVAVRQAAGHALAALADPASTPEIRRRLVAHQNDNINVVVALQAALNALDSETDSV
jgi:HEAT repeat protein